MITTIASAIAATSWSSNASAAKAADEISIDQLLNMSLEELTNIQITSVSKKAEKANEAAAALFVITQEDIKSSGAGSIPEVLRIVPGLNVAQSGSHQWAISARGFNDQFANKLLVLIDGRSVYTPIYSGVYWDVQDTPLEDIERIEIIRGPGATLWGANAVNGVINIITKKAGDTQGGYASFSAGNINRADTTIRYGGKIADNANMRVYAKYNENDEFRTATNLGAGDEWNKSQTGFRADWELNEGRTYTLQGDIYRGGEDYSFQLPPSTITNASEKVLGSNLLARWTEKISDTSESSIQLYYDNAKRSHFVFTNEVDVFDVDAQHIWNHLHGQEIVWGAGYRLVKSDISQRPYVSFTPANRSDNLFSAFVQDKITLNPDNLFLTLGSKFEKNDYTGFEYQPSARLSWLVNENQTLWASISRAVRTPNISTAGVQIVGTQIAAGPTVFLAQKGVSHLNSEDLIAYEFGYRIQPEKNISIDASSFYNNYNDLVLGRLDAVTGPFTNSTLGTYLLQTIIPVNNGSAHAFGGELSAKWNPTEKLELVAGYTLQKIKFEQLDLYGFSFVRKSPEHQLNLRSTVSFTNDLEWNTSIYYNGDVKALDFYSGRTTDSYYRLDTRLAWQPTDNVELSLVGQNLLDPRHKEFAGFIYQNSSQVPRSYYANLAFKF